MEGSRRSHQDSFRAVFLAKVNTRSKGMSSMTAHGGLGANQDTVSLLPVRTRTSLSQSGTLFTGSVEADETYFGGMRENMPKSKRKNLEGRSASDKIAARGAKDRPAKWIAVKVIRSTDKDTLQDYIQTHKAPSATICTDDSAAYEVLSNNHVAIEYSPCDCVKGHVHINGIESLWSMMKRTFKGTFRKLSPKHFDRCIQESTERHAVREEDALEQIESMHNGIEFGRVMYPELTPLNGLAPRT